MSTKHENPAYQCWFSMKQRCQYEKHPYYAKYGGSGITVCDRWQSFDSFIEDMGDRPSSNHTLERINNKVGYEPGNVRWATRKEQARNTSRNVWIEFAGMRMIITDWAHWCGIQLPMFIYRTKQGWNPERIKQYYAYTNND